MKKKRASDLLRDVAAKRQSSDVILLYELKESLHEKGFGIFLLLFSLPLSIPIPVPPGYTTIFAIPLLLFSTQMLFGFDSPWIPNWLARKAIKRSILVAIVEKTAPSIIKIESIMRHRFFLVVDTQIGERLYSMVCVLCSAAIAIPLPLTNFVPAVGIVFIAIGVIGKDGLFVLLGIIIGILGAILTLIITFFGLSILNKLLALIL